MKQRMVSFLILIAALCQTSAAWAQAGFRLIQLNDEGDSREVVVTDLSNRGDVVGSRSNGSGALRAFRWRNGEYTDLHDVVAPGSSFTQAAGINDRSTIVGFRSVPNFEGFVLRGTQVTPLPVVAGETNVFPTDINNRGQIIVDSFGGPQSGSFFVDRGQAELLPGLPNSSDTMRAANLNDLGAVIGTTQTTNGSRAILWRNGTVTDLGVVSGAGSSLGRDVNNRNQAVGILNFADGPAAFLWQNGKMTVLPPLPPTTARVTEASSINDFGVVAGHSRAVSGEQQTATLWLGQRVIDVNTLIRPDDPLRPYVHLQNASQINNRGDIIATGIDSRQPAVVSRYFLTLFDDALIESSQPSLAH